MNDLQIAKNNLIGHTICLCKDGKCLYSEKKGIGPMMNFIETNTNLEGYCVADVIVGKAVAMLFVRSGIIKVYAKTLSKSGKAILEKYGIPFEYDELTEQIINRTGTDICPMEKAVLNTEDLDEAYLLLKKQQAILMNNKR